MTFDFFSFCYGAFDSVRIVVSVEDELETISFIKDWKMKVEDGSVNGDYGYGYGFPMVEGLANGDYGYGYGFAMVEELRLKEWKLRLWRL